MWILILTVQFITLKSHWLINYPTLTRTFFTELRKVTMGEFFDDLELGEKINSAIGA